MATLNADIELHHEAQGSGPPLVLIHGFGANTYSWRHVVPVLAKAYRVIVVDLKGFGRSPKPDDGRYGIHDQVTLMASFTRRHGLGRPTLIGHSFGGGVALLLALRLQDDPLYQPRQLVLLDSIAYRQPLPMFMRALRNPLAGPLAAWLVPPRMLVRYVLKLAFHDQTRIPEDAVVRYGATLRAPEAKRALLRTAVQLVPPDIDRVVQTYGQLRAPTLIIWGEEDRIVPPALGRRLHMAIPDSKLTTIETCGHMPHEERPERTIALLEGFLEALVQR